MEPNIQVDSLIEQTVGPNTGTLPVISIGMEFVNHEEAWLLFVNYASIKGFQPRKHTTYKSTKTQVTIGRTYVCSKEGTNRTAILKEVTKRKREKREMCPARMRITLDQERQVWRVTQFIDDHCHELHTSTIRQLHKKIRASNMGSECVTVIRHFQDRVKTDPMFFFAIELDADRTFRNVFWADGQSRKAYLEFNDVVSFDVTYRTDKFSMPFAPFTGVNHHRQSTLFGCALLADETEDSFVWLFTQWLNCMFGIPPKVIITDQDRHICSAIKHVFPSTHHRYCSWHVNNHAIEHIGLHKPSHEDFTEDFYIWFNSESVVESESRWETLKAKYNMGDRNWLVTMYEKRKHWVPVYLREVFTCGMKSTQRSESINAFFDGYVNSMTPLTIFVEQYDKAVASRRKAEKDEDFATITSKPCCESGLPWERQAASFYTRNSFQIFHQEFVTSQSYMKEKISKDGGKMVYRVGKPDVDKKRWRIVAYDVSDGVNFTCSCAKFETEGMLCRHIMAILRLKQVHVIPEKYFLKRWSINSRSEPTWDCSSSLTSKEDLGNEAVTPMMLFSLQYKHLQVLEEASSSVSVLKDYDTYLDTFLTEIARKKLETHTEDASQNPSKSDPIGSISRITIRDPKQRFEQKEDQKLHQESSPEEKSHKKRRK